MLLNILLFYNQIFFKDNFLYNHSTVLNIRPACLVLLGGSPVAFKHALVSQSLIRPRQLQVLIKAWVLLQMSVLSVGSRCRKQNIWSWHTDPQAQSMSTNESCRALVS